MLVKYIVVVAVLLCVVSLYWVLRGLALAPVKGGKNIDITMQLDARGETHELEHILKGLIWLRDNGTLKTDININLREPDSNTRLVAMAFSKDYHFISYNELGE